MKRILAALVLLCVATSAQAQFTKAQLNAQVSANFPDNTSFEILPSNVRTVTGNIINSILPTAPVVSGNLACFNGTTGLLQDCGTAPTTNPIIVGTTPITNGTNGNVLVQTSGIVGEVGTTGSGNVVFSTAPNLNSPTGILKSDVGLGNVANVDTTNATNISTGTLAAARGGAGTITGALKGSGAGVVSQAACADLSDGSSTACNQTYIATTWTPTFIGSVTAGTGQTYSTRAGSYEQIGRHITIRFNLVASSLGTAAGNIEIGGLPVAAANIANDDGVCWISVYAVTGLTAGDTGIVGFIVPNTSVIIPLSNGNAAQHGITIGQAGATVEMVGGCEYHN
jgi:hypothetical protein